METSSIRTGASNSFVSLNDNLTDQASKGQKLQAQKPIDRINKLGLSKRVLQWTDEAIASGNTFLKCLAYFVKGPAWLCLFLGQLGDAMSRAAKYPFTSLMAYKFSDENSEEYIDNGLLRMSKKDMERILYNDDPYLGASAPEIKDLEMPAGNMDEKSQTHSRKNTSQIEGETTVELTSTNIYSTQGNPQTDEEH